MSIHVCLVHLCSCDVGWSSVVLHPGLWGPTIGEQGAGMGEGWCPQAHRAAARPQRRPCLGPWELPLQPLGHLWGGDGGFSLEQPSPEDPWPRTTTFPLLGCRGCQGGASPRGRAGMGWAPLHTLTKFLLGYRAGVGSWCPEWSPRGPHGPRGKDQRNEPTLRARPGCSFPCCSHSLFSSLSTNHISLSLSPRFVA